MKKRLIPVVLVLAALAAGAWYYYQGRDGSAEARPVFYGNVDIREVVLGFRVAGRIDRMAFDEGDKVVAGQTLAALDKKPFLDNLALQTAAIDQAEANLQKLKAGQGERAYEEVAPGLYWYRVKS